MVLAVGGLAGTEIKPIFSKRDLSSPMKVCRKLLSLLYMTDRRTWYFIAYTAFLPSKSSTGWEISTLLVYSCMHGGPSLYLGFRQTPRSARMSVSYCIYF